jgi:hypothetical protein
MFHPMRKPPHTSEHKAARQDDAIIVHRRRVGRHSVSYNSLARAQHSPHPSPLTKAEHDIEEDNQ